jgi:putative membrane protein
VVVSTCEGTPARMKVSGFSADTANGNRRAVLLGALAVPATALLAIAAPSPGPLSWHMAGHVALMNVAAPLAALGLTRRAVQSTGMWAAPSVLWIVTLAQLAVLWASHSPAVQHHVQAEHAGVVALHALLFLVALVFWLSVLGAAAHRWQAMLALLVSGKFVCLLGVLFTFAPRPLFASLHARHLEQKVLLADQHLAGLLMIAACPLSYVLTAVALAVQAVNGLDETRARSPSASSFGR